MNDYRHHVSGFFAREEEARNASAELVRQGLLPERLHILTANSDPAALARHEGDNTVLSHVLVDGAIGTAVGTGVGALAELALVAADVSLFVASPLIAPLAMLGWGASLGGLLGAAVGAESQAGNKAAAKGSFSSLIRDAITNNQVVLLAETRTEAETNTAQQVLKSLIGSSEDVSAV